MWWGNCGNDSEGRPIGYIFSAKCDHPGCEKDIDRGLSYACGGMHGNTEFGCEKYFCEEHRPYHVLVHGDYEQVCESCGNELIASGEFIYSDDEGCIVPSIK